MIRLIPSVLPSCFIEYVLSTVACLYSSALVVDRPEFKYYVTIHGSNLVLRFVGEPISLLASLLLVVMLVTQM